MIGGRNQQLRADISRDFTHVKRDVEALNIRILLLESENKRLKEELIKKENDELKRKISEKTDQSQESLSLSKLRLIMEEMIGKTLKEQNTKASSIFSAETEQEFSPIFPENKYVREEREYQEEVEEEIIEKTNTQAIQKKEHYREKDGLKSDLLKSFQRNRKNLIKQQILGEMQKGEHSKLDLRDVIVEQKKYCSKASFYRYVEELELENIIGQHRRKGRDIIFAKQTRIISSPREEPSLTSENER